MKLDELEAKANGVLERWKSGAEIMVDAAVVLNLIALLRDLRACFDSAHRIGCICVGCEALAKLEEP